jgi:transcriptional regulator with XRE-family HTH domain
MPKGPTSSREIKIDQDIATAIRKVRKGGGRSQMWLAEQVGISYQQLQKYEAGINRMSASRLVSIARALKEPLATFLPKE